MAQRALRFGVTDGDGRRAATWKLWTETSGGKADVYLAGRGLGGFLKASLHESGQWHVAYTNGAYEGHVKGAIPTLADRFIEKWPRPPEIAPGVTLAFRIITPHSAVTANISTDNTKRVMWIPNAPPAKATDTYLFLVQSNTTVSGWPGQRGMGTDLVGSLPLESGETVWVVYRVIPTPDLSQLNGKGAGYFYKGKGREDLKNDGMRALVFGQGHGGSRVIYDCAVAPHIVEKEG